MSSYFQISFFISYFYVLLSFCLIAFTVCVIVRTVWEALRLVIVAFLAAGTFVAWLEVVPRKRAVQFLVHVWFIWRRRCRMVFEDVLESWQSVLYSVASILQMLALGLDASPAVRWAAWKRPPEGWVALNINGSSLHNPGCVGIGV